LDPNDGRLYWTDSWPSDKWTEDYDISRLAHYVGNSSADDAWTIGTVPTYFSRLRLQESLILFHDGETTVSEYQNLRSANTTWTLQSLQPVVKSVCSFVVDATANISLFRTDGSTSILPNANDLYSSVLNNNYSQHWQILWLPMPHDPTSLLALFRSHYNPPRYHICTVSSFWWSTVTSLSLAGISGILQTDRPSTSGTMVHEEMTSITIDPEGIVSLWSAEMEDKVMLPYSIPLTGLFLAALSYIPQEVIYHRHGWSRTENGGPTSRTKIKIDETIYGFGYGSTDTPTQLSLAVIVVYCLVTMMYLVYINITGHTSMAWNSATELMILALQSKEPDNLGHVSVGLDSMDTFRRSVGIRVATSKIADTGEDVGRLELVFEHDEGVKRRNLKKVERNKAY
jgi:hypothetical protein